MLLVLITLGSCFTGCVADDELESDTAELASGLYSDIDSVIERDTEGTDKSASTTKPASSTSTSKEPDPIPGQTQATKALTAKTYNLGNASDRSNFRTVGRVQYSDTGILFDHCANVLEFQGYMTGDLKLNANSSGDNKNDWTYLTVYIDGKRVDKRMNCSAKL